MRANQRYIRSIQAWRQAAALCGYLLAGAVSPAQSGVSVEVITDLGRIVLEVDERTPVHRDRFLDLVRSGAYDGLLFHRAIPGFVVQGGDPGSREHTTALIGLDPPIAPLAPEIVPGLVHVQGALAAVPVDMEDGSIYSHGQQFCIVLGRSYTPAELDRIAERHRANGRPVTYTDRDRERYAARGGAPHLDGGNTVFGRVVEGMDVVEAIANEPCDMADRPKRDIRMQLRILR
jgi:peptidyl-prolyl cis-trans isomerase B (cyclophilin B)